MPKRISEIASSLKQLGEIQVTDWDFKGLLNKDIKDLEIGPSLRQLGSTKVIDWAFKEVLPTVHEFVHQEVDGVGWVKRVAHYKVMEWDFRSVLPHEGKERSGERAQPLRKIPSPEEMQSLVVRLKGGKVEFRVDKGGNVHSLIGKASFEASSLEENARALLSEIVRAKPSGAKGQYMRSVTFSTTMGPGLKLDPVAATAVVK